MTTAEPRVVIDITQVKRGPSGFMVTGTVGFREKIVFVDLTEVAEKIGNDPANYSLADLTPAIVDCAFPALRDFFTGRPAVYPEAATKQVNDGGDDYFPHTILPLGRNR